MEFFSKIVAERCRLFLQKNSIRDAGGGGEGVTPARVEVSHQV